MVGLKKTKATIVIDIDGTLLEYEKYEPFVFGYPIAGSIDAMRELKSAGYRIELYTARPKKERAELMRHLHELGILKIIDNVTSGKPIGHVYIDDRAVRFRGDWKACLIEVNSALAVELKATVPVKPRISRKDVG